MAVIHRLANYDQSISFSFLAGGTLRPLLDTWQTSAITPDGTIEESCTLFGKNVDANITAAVDLLGDLSESIRRFLKDRAEGDSVWYEINIASGEVAKRALLYNLEVRSLHTNKYIPVLGQGAAFYELEFERSAAFEDVASFGTTPTACNILGGTISLGTYAQTLPGRIEKLNMASSNALEEFWIGVRSTGAGVANFNPLWQCEDALTLGTDTTIQSDAAASPGTTNNVLRTTFASGTAMANRFIIKLDDVTASTNYHHFVGEYLVLLRCKVDSGATVGVRMFTGYDNTLTAIYQPTYYRPVYGITNTSYLYKELGVISIPSFGYRRMLRNNSLVQNYTIGVQAERTGGTGSNAIFFDCLVLIPYQHFIHISKAEMSAARSVDVYMDELGEMTAFMSQSNAALSNMEVQSNNWEYPVDGGVLVFAAERVTASDTTDSGTVTLTLRRRYRVHAPN